MDCVICKREVEAWPGGGGYGHNPAPWPLSPSSKDEDAFRCCNWCNENIVIPLRMRMAGALSC